MYGYRWDRKRKLVFWGIGEVGKRCLKNYTEVRPLFFIDSYAESIEGYDYDIIRPSQIIDWSEYFIVITVENKAAIESLLKEYNLLENIDYVGFELFFGIKASGSMRTLDYVRKVITEGTIRKHKNIIAVPFYYSERMEHICTFFKRYIKQHGEEKYLLLHSIQYIDDEQMKADFSCDMLPYRIPELKDLDEKVWQEKLKLLSEEELIWVEKVEQRKRSAAPLPLIQLRYIYYKELLDILEPNAIIWWGGWARDSYIVQHIAQKRGVRFAIGEHGWLSGTINIDFEGIAGQSQFCVTPEIYKSRISMKEYDAVVFKEIAAYLLSKEKKNKAGFLEWSKINQMDKSRPAFLLVGMADYGMDINPESSYWAERISECVSGSTDALGKCAKVCQKYGWNLIYKPHPKEQAEQVIEKVDMDGVKFVQDIPIEYLIELSDVCISITSAVDYSVLLYGKPLVQLGKNSLNMAECTYVVSKASEIENQMLAAMKYGFTKHQKENYERHMLQLLQTVLWDDLTEKLRYGRSVEDRIFNE